MIDLKAIFSINRDFVQDEERINTRAATIPHFHHEGNESGCRIFNVNKIFNSESRELATIVIDEDLIPFLGDKDFCGKGGFTPSTFSDYCLKHFLSLSYFSLQIFLFADERYKQPSPLCLEL
jgi:hypothetical protein